MLITVPGRLAGANEYILKCRTNRIAASSFKGKQEARIKAAVYDSLHHKPIPFDSPVVLHYHWYEQNRRRDKDNIAFAHKFVQDALVRVGLLRGDGWEWVYGFTDAFSVDSKNPRVEIEIEVVK